MQFVAVVLVSSELERQERLRSSGKVGSTSAGGKELTSIALSSVSSLLTLTCLQPLSASTPGTPDCRHDSVQTFSHTESLLYRLSVPWLVTMCRFSRTLYGTKTRFPCFLKF
jgi:hypothetical protein